MLEVGYGKEVLFWWKLTCRYSVVYHTFRRITTVVVFPYQTNDNNDPSSSQSKITDKTDLTSKAQETAKRETKSSSKSPSKVCLIECALYVQVRWWYDV